MGQSSFKSLKITAPIERMQRIDALVVDKSGTLTEGRPKVVAVKPAAGYSEPEVLLLAASVERASEHPRPTLGRAIFSGTG